MSIFKAYDIRGIYPSEVNEQLAYKLGRAFVVFTKAKQVVVGYDARLSSEKIFDSLTKGILDQGANVVNVGLCTTPMFNFIHAHFKYQTGIMVTASHNPKEYNGFKLNTFDATPLTGDSGIMDIKALVEKDVFEQSAEKGLLTEADHFEEYVDFMVGLIKEDLSTLHIVVDGSSGPVGRICEAVFMKLGIDYVPLNFEPDGNFPSHDPNPLKGDSQELAKRKVLEEGADFGCLFDADADRIVFVNELGKTVQPDLIAALLVKKALKDNPGGKVLYDCISSRSVQKVIDDFGGKGIVSRVGRSYLYLTAKNEEVVLGSEASSHYYHPEVYYSDNGLLTLLKIMELLVYEQVSLSDAVKPFDIYFHSGEVNLEVKDKEAAVERIKSEFSDGKQSVLDGISISYDNVWFNVRPSNTEPLLRIRIEGTSEKMVNEFKEKILRIVSD